MRYFAFVDRAEHVSAIRSLAAKDDQLRIVWFREREEWMPDVPDGGGIDFWSHIDLDALGSFDITEDDRVILSTGDAGPFAILIEILSSRSRPPAILLLTENSPGFPRHQQPNMVILDLDRTARQVMNREWEVLEARRKALRLRETLAGGRKIAILTQNDPDPDAIASGMAVQALLGRTDETASLVTFGAVTRNENLAMLSLLKTAIRTITPIELSAFDRVVMVDVQPPYFGDTFSHTVDAVIDHHPYPHSFACSFYDVDPACGATSTMLYEYLVASETYIDEPVATGLLYGITTDTMNLSRDTTRRDFDAFTALWPRANIQLLSSMSRPRLKPDELRYFVRAIKNRKIIRDMIFIWLDTVRQEDIIPRLADFGTQFGEVTWSAVGGVYEGNVVISLRYLGGERDAGVLMKGLFGAIGSAGGHTSAAKGVIPLAYFRREHGVRNMTQLRELLQEWFAKGLAEEG
ncbi:MAG: DHH family phosphoesterase [Nitrospinae bacterium]|nr:DHH family phosphoesterase [Nitrospinota bacterium]